MFVRVVLVFLGLGMGTGAVAAVGPRAVQTALLDGYSVRLSAISWVDEKGVGKSISQISEPDDICRVFQLGESFGYVTSSHATGSHPVLRGDGTLDGAEKSPVYTEVYCSSVSQTKAGPRGFYSYKERLKNGDVVITAPYVLPQEEKTYYEYSAQSDLDGLCKLYGYGSKVSSEISGRYESTRFQMQIFLVDASGHLSGMGFQNLISSTSNDRITKITCTPKK